MTIRSQYGTYVYCSRCLIQSFGLVFYLWKFLELHRAYPCMVIRFPVTAGRWCFMTLPEKKSATTWAVNQISVSEFCKCIDEVYWRAQLWKLLEPRHDGNYLSSHTYHTKWLQFILFPKAKLHQKFKVGYMKTSKCLPCHPTIPQCSPRFKPLTSKRKHGIYWLSVLSLK